MATTTNTTLDDLDPEVLTCKNQGDFCWKKQMHILAPSICLSSPLLWQPVHHPFLMKLALGRKHANTIRDQNTKDGGATI
eukprot:scaffold26340_cov103-Cylindrotheca_fusiformis.AAC.5